MIDLSAVAELASWITPAMLVGVLAWLRADIRRSEDRQLELMAQMEKRQSEHMVQMEQRQNERMVQMEGRLENRMVRVEERVGGVEREVAEMKGKLDVVERYVMGRNDPAGGSAD